MMDEKELLHYGVPGMRWGQRKTAVKTIDKSITKITKRLIKKRKRYDKERKRYDKLFKRLLKTCKRSAEVGKRYVDSVANTFMKEVYNPAKSVYAKGKQRVESMMQRDSSYD